jgi:ElaB/YqjD/DUF883 family membrane-anchored ribosome-binding protein
MTDNMETVFSDLQQVIAEVEKGLAASAGDVTAQSQEAVTGWRNTLKGAQDQLETLQRNTRHRIAGVAHSATHALHTNPWRSVALAAAAGFVLGLVVGSHNGSRH